MITVAASDLVNDQLKVFLCRASILSPFQSSFRAGHITVTAVTLVINDIVSASDNKKNHAALFVGLSKGFDTVDHCLLLQRLHNNGLSINAYNWYRNYLSEATIC